MPGILYIVATPIGNLEDVTLRALRVLREVSLIAAEDTRRTARLLQHYSISTPTTSLHQHNEHQRGPGLLARLLAGESIALVSDAGTPVVSDPGTALVASAHGAGIRVEPIPGASAITAALSASGIPAEQFSFVGFPPARGRARTDWFVSLGSETRAFIVYEAPHRIRQTLADLLTAVGDRVVAVGRELTKVHESLVVRPISTHLEALAEPRGEYTIVVSAPEQAELGRTPYTSTELVEQFSELTDEGRSPREAVRTLALKYHLPSRDVYAIVHALADDLGE
jgi:16S rRNA (cytidine1402-2'-O)-methyltransferase